MNERTGEMREVARIGLAAVPLLGSMLLLGIAVQKGSFLAFAIAWPAAQVIGYGSTIRLARGDLSHPLVAAQITLHWLVTALLVALAVRTI